MLRKHLVEFVLRTIIQPFLLVFVFLYVFPEIGQTVGGRGSSAFATVLVPGRGRHLDHVPGRAVGGPAALAGVRVHRGRSRTGCRPRARCGWWRWRRSWPASFRGCWPPSSCSRSPALIHAPGVHAEFDIRWWIVVTLLPLACLVFSALGLVLGCVFEPRNIGLMFGFIVLPITFLGGTYYQWTRLAPVKVGGFHWLQVLVLINPLDLRQRGPAGRLHEHLAYAPLHHLSGADRLLRRLPGHRYPGFPQAGAVLSPPASHPVLRRPAAMPLMVSSRARWRSGSGEPGFAHPFQQGHLQVVNRRQVGGPDREGAAEDRGALEQLRWPVTHRICSRVRWYSASTLAKIGLQRGGNQLFDVAAGDVHVGLDQRHLDVGQEVGEEAPAVAHLQQVRPRGPARRAAASPDPTPNQPGTIWRDCVQPNTHGMARSPSQPGPAVRAARRPGAEVQGAELVDRGRTS